jgi:3-phenylpropionate/cinnamic acid dioxygenase small subunit
VSDSRTAIEALLYTYAECIDAGDFEGVGALFADGRITAAGAPGATSGRDAVRALYTATVRVYADGTPRTRHVTSNVVIEIDEPAAVARACSYFTVLQQVDDFPLQPIVTGRYRDRFARVDGRWHFAERHMTIDLVGDVSRHLLIALPAARGQ